MDAMSSQLFFHSREELVIVYYIILKNNYLSCRSIIVSCMRQAFGHIFMVWMLANHVKCMDQTRYKT